MIREVLWEIRTKPLSNLLALLGLSVGVFAVVTMGSLGVVEERRIVKEMERMGADRIVIVPKKVELYPFRRGFKGLVTTLKLREILEMRERIEGIKYIAPSSFIFTKVKGEKGYAETTVLGTFPDYLNIMNFKVIQGMPFVEEEKGFVCLLGDTVRRRIFKGNPLGKFVLINNISFRIIGLLNKKGLDASGQDQDDIIIVPLLAILSLYNQNYIPIVFVKPMDPSKVDLLIKDMELFLTEKHGKKDFEVKSMVGFVKRKIKIAGITRKSTLAVSMVALIVGGIGIMSLMIIRGRERIREIGIKRAVGATKKRIFYEFISEAFVLSMIGGGIGLFFGLITAAFIFFKNRMNLLIPWDLAIISFTLSLFTGTIFGVYPAYRASKVDVVETLREE